MDFTQESLLENSIRTHTTETKNPFSTKHPPLYPPPG
jgi:hypothetical protein